MKNVYVQYVIEFRLKVHATRRHISQGNQFPEAKFLTPILHQFLAFATTKKRRRP